MAKNCNLRRIKEILPHKNTNDCHRHLVLTQNKVVSTDPISPFSWADNPAFGLLFVFWDQLVPDIPVRWHIFYQQLKNVKIFVYNCFMPSSLHILVTSFFVFWLYSTKIVFYVCLLTFFARQDWQNGNLKNEQNHATKVTKIQKKNKLRKWHEPKIRFIFSKINFWKKKYLILWAPLVLLVEHRHLLRVAVNKNWQSYVKYIIFYLILRMFLSSNCFSPIMYMFSIL